jgi:hypothetical protein
LIKNECKFTLFGLDGKKLRERLGIMVLGNGVFVGGWNWLAFADGGWYWLLGPLFYFAALR